MYVALIYLPSHRSGQGLNPNVTKLRLKASTDGECGQCGQCGECGRTREQDELPSLPPLSLTERDSAYLRGIRLNPFILHLSLKPIEKGLFTLNLYNNISVTLKMRLFTLSTINKYKYSRRI